MPRAASYPADLILRDAPSVLLAADAVPPLAAWYAEPPGPAELGPARQRLQARQTQSHRTRGGTAAPALRLAELVLAHWAGRSAGALHASLVAEHRDQWAALAELIYGQLLLGRRLQDAWAHLDRGFALAAPHWQGRDYFRVLDRHTRLRALPLYVRPRPPQGLRGLLAEAELVARLRGRRPHEVPRGSHLDTLG